MTDATAAAILEEQAADLGIHSRDCRTGIALVDEIWSEGCATCARGAARAARSELEAERMAFELAYETNLEHREEMEREAAMFGRGW